MNFNKSYEKVRCVLESCKNEDQLDIGKIYSYKLLKRYGDYNEINLPIGGWSDLFWYIYNFKINTKTYNRCKCVNVKMGSYDNQIWVHSPSHMPKENGYCLDMCIAEEIMQLWMQGITTTGCCCGHNLEGEVGSAYIGVDFKDISKMKDLGYKVLKNNLRPEDEDSFIPKFL